MPRRKSKTSIRKALTKFLRKIITWRIAVFALCALSIILIVNILYCIVTPCTYPTNNLKDIVRIRSLENQPPIFSSVTFVDVPVNTKQRIVVNLNSLIEIEVNTLRKCI